MSGATTRRRDTDRPGGRSTAGRPVRGGAHKPARRQRWVVIGALAVITILVAVVYFTPLLAVRTIRVTGNASIDQQRVVDESGLTEDTPMPRVDTTEAGENVERITEVARAQVTQHWPDTVEIAVRERTPAAYQAHSGAFDLVDVQGVRLDRVAERPADLPALRLGTVSTPATESAVTPLRALPPELRSEVEAVIAENPQDIRLRLTEGRQVHWGASRDAARKAQVLSPLLTQPGQVYDVTTPELPTIA